MPMGKKKPDLHHDSAFALRMHPLMRFGLDLLAEKRVSDVTSEIKEAIRERLEKHNLWPIPEEHMDAFRARQKPQATEPTPNAKRPTPKPAKRKRNQDEV